MKTKILIILLLLLLILSNGYWIYSNIDNSVTQSYHNHVTWEFANKIKANAMFGNFYIQRVSKDSALAIMNNIYGPDNVFEKDNCINTIWINLIIEDGFVKEIEIDENVKEWAK